MAEFGEHVQRQIEVLRDRGWVSTTPVRMVPVQPRIVTFADWVNARTPGRVVYYEPEDRTPTY